MSNVKRMPAADLPFTLQTIEHIYAQVTKGGQRNRVLEVVWPSGAMIRAAVGDDIIGFAGDDDEQPEG